MRVMVRNTGGGIIAIAFEVNSLTDLNALGGTYLLPGGGVDVFVLAPGQSLYAGALGGVGQASIAISEAFPTSRWMES